MNTWDTEEDLVRIGTDEKAAAMTNRRRGAKTLLCVPCVLTINIIATSLFGFNVECVISTSATKVLANFMFSVFLNFNVFIILCPVYDPEEKYNFDKG